MAATPWTPTPLPWRAWGATWRDGELHLSPKYAVLDNEQAPKRAPISTPEGEVVMEYRNGTVSAVSKVSFAVHVDRAGAQSGQRAS